MSHHHSTSADLADQLSRVARRMRRGAHQAFAPLGLTPAQHRTLRVISRARKPVRMGQLAEHMGIVPRSATDLVNKLVEADLVIRDADPENRRVVLVSLSEKGRELRAAMDEARRVAATELLAPLSDAQGEQLATILATLLENSDDGECRGGRNGRRHGGKGQVFAE